MSDKFFNTKIKNQNNRAFTLIELLVVVAIIGILSSVVLASLNSARDKARLAAGKQADSNISHGIGDQLVGEWKFDDTSNPWIDTSGNNLNGSCSPCPILVSGYNGKNAVSFDGTNKQISVGNSALLSFPDNTFTVSFWVKYSTPNSIGILGKRAPWEYSVYEEGNSKLAFSVWSSEGNTVYISGLLNAPNSEWHHYILSTDGSKMNIYADGSLVKTTPYVSPYAMSQTSSPLYIGSGGDGTATRYMNGLIDDVRIYSTSTSAVQVKKIYAQELKGLIFAKNK